MKVTSAKTLQALRAARGERTWSEFAAAAKRDQSGAIIVRSSDAGRLISAEQKAKAKG
jgi:hypothetical protein